MSFSFRTILVPLDFPVNTEVAVKKAVEVADAGRSTIHMIHVFNSTLHNISEFNRQKSKEFSRGEEKKKMLLQWKNSIEESFPSIFRSVLGKDLGLISWKGVKRNQVSGNYEHVLWLASDFAVLRGLSSY